MFEKFNIVTLVGASMMLGASMFTQPAMAGEQPNVLVVGEDADRDTVPRNSRVFNRVLQAMTGELSQFGFKVYDETAVSMDITTPGRTRRVDTELITIAQQIQQVPIDVITVFQIYASVSKNPYADIMELRVRVPGRMLQVQTGQTLGNFEVSYGSKDLAPLPPNCNRDCMLEHVGDQAKTIARDVGSVLAQKLDFQSPPRQHANTPDPTIDDDPEPDEDVVTQATDCTGMTTAYSLIFRGFDPEEFTSIEEYIVAFKGYDHHRPVRSQLREIDYWYETCSDVARLNRNLRLMLEQIDVVGRLSQRGNRFEVDKIAYHQTR